MNPSKWAEILSKEGFAIVFSGYFGGFRFWVHPEKKGLFKTFLYKITIKLLNIIGKFIKGNALFYSKYCGIVAIKK